ncbi:peptide MFS transporter [uncultured Shewanella sp.]|uniref:peptide MFS transporter n=1 Tax=uncultured Shewanella sp. TaxID=173975 RepID=UPI002634227C|nr:peptide MFS transporter [uncultured Shewanella sp.]
MINNSITIATHSDTTHSIVRHPRGLYVCFFTEMWERFSFYGLKALLIFYLTEHFLFSDKEATQIFGNFFALVYALPLLGGLIADRYLGYKKAVIFGGVLLCFGHLGMAFEGTLAYINDAGIKVESTGLTAFYVSLSFIIVGIGFLKPNISTIVGQLYSTNDPRKDAGFTLFYMGINLGAALAAIICGYVGRQYGWHYGFGLAGIGMLIGLCIFILNQRHLTKASENKTTPKKIKPQRLGKVKVTHLVYLAAFALITFISLCVSNHQIVGSLLGFTLIIASLGLIIYCLYEKSQSVKRHLYAALSLIMMSTVFFLCFLQSGSSMNLFAERITDRTLLGIDIPSPMFQSLNAIFIILMAPVFSKLWLTLNEHNKAPSTPAKFAIGLFLVGLGFAALLLGLYFSHQHDPVAMIWLIIAYFLHTLGELCISPIGLSMITKLSTPKMAGLMMGLWFLGSAIAEYIAAFLAGSAGDIATQTTRLVEGTTATLTQHQMFTSLYTDIMWIAFIGAAVTLLLTPLIKHWMGDID